MIFDAVMIVTVIVFLLIICACGYMFYILDDDE